MAASSSGSCNSLTSNYVNAGSADPRPRTSKEAELCACDTFGQALQGGITPERNHGQGGTVTSECDVKHSAPTRKAEREKLRRDRLNEQLLELAGALEPDRPKNDKSTILGDAIQTLKELMADVERLRAEHTLLVDESQDLSQEKKELHEERQQLTAKVQHMQNQVCQQMHAMLLWMAAGPASMMGASSSSPHGEIDVGTCARPSLGPSQIQIPFLGPQPMPPVPASMAVHPALQAHYGYSGRGAPYFPYSFSCSDGGPSQAEGPCAHVPHSLQGYPLQVHQGPLMPPMQSLSQAAPYSQAYGSHYPFIIRTVTENQNAIDAGVMAGASSGHNEQHLGSSSVKQSTNEHLANPERHIRTAIQLQTPAIVSDPQLQSQQGFGRNEAMLSYRENSLPPY